MWKFGKYRTKLKQTEVDCEFLKRCCQTLTEENRKLHKEVQELRALKSSPQFYMQMTPPTTLTMCPSCERVASPRSATTSAVGPSITLAEPLRAHPMSTNHHRLPFNPWASQHRPSDALHPRSWEWIGSKGFADDLPRMAVLNEQRGHCCHSKYSYNLME